MWSQKHNRLQWNWTSQWLRTHHGGNLTTCSWCRCQATLGLWRQRWIWRWLRWLVWSNRLLPHRVCYLPGALNGQTPTREAKGLSQLVEVALNPLHVGQSSLTEALCVLMTCTRDSWLRCVWSSCSKTSGRLWTGSLRPHKDYRLSGGRPLYRHSTVWWDCSRWHSRNYGSRHRPR